MPVPIAREIDDALKELVQWRINDARESKTVSREEAAGSTIDWDRYPVEAQCRIHKMLLSPICYAFVGLFPQLVRESESTTRLVYIIIFILTIKPASRQVPFQQIPGLFMLVSTLPLLLPVNIMALTTPMIWLDTFGSPLIYHILEDISDREGVHYVLISILLCFVSELTAIVLCHTTSLIGTVVIGIVATLIVQIIAMLLIFCPPFQISLIRWTCQSNLFWVSHTIRQWLIAFLQRRPPSREDILIPLESDQSFYNDLPKESIRLLKIRRGRYQEEISCEFVIASVASANKIEPYEAISYVWGDPTPSRRIVVDGKALAITESAYDILLRRRSMWRDRLIWMDQICINQDDEKPEKTAQVKMMSQIYSHASLVTAWLGHSPDAHLVQTLIAELHYAKEGLGSSPQELKSHHWYKTKPQEARWAAFGKFIRNRWFRRVWIIQEVALAKRLHIIYGDTCMDWTYVSRGLALLNHPLMLDCVPWVKPNRLTRKHLGTGLENGDLMMSLRGDIYYSQPITLSWVLHKSIYFKSTDPRDKIFALLGLTTDDSPRVIKLDYRRSNTARAVYIKTMEYLLYGAKDPVGLLCSAGIGHQRKTLNLPSWVQDWSFASRSYFKAEWYSANTDISPPIRLDVDSATLRLDGEVFDEIAHKSSIYGVQHDTDPLYEALDVASWLAEVEALAVGSRDPYYTGEGRSEALFRTIVGDQYDGKNDRPTDKQCEIDYATLKKYLRKFPWWIRQKEAVANASRSEDLPPWLEKVWKPMQDLETEYARILRLINGICGSRRFCVTKEGRMGIVPECCEESDKICIFNGGRMPFCLRQKAEASYELVVCCYVYGIMGGEKKVENPEEIILI